MVRYDYRLEWISLHALIHPGGDQGRGFAPPSGPLIGDCGKIRRSGDQEIRSFFKFLIFSSVSKCVCSIRGEDYVHGFQLLEPFPTAVFDFSPWGGKAVLMSLRVPFHPRCREGFLLCRFPWDGQLRKPSQRMGAADHLAGREEHIRCRDCRAR